MTNDISLNGSLSLHQSSDDDVMTLRVLLFVFYFFWNAINLFMKNNSNKII